MIHMAMSVQTTMSDHKLYTILALWLFCALFMGVWGWLELRRFDRQHEADEARQVEKDAEWDEWISEMATKQKGKVFDLPHGKELDFQARSRQAESLGFMDEPPKRAS